MNKQTIIMTLSLGFIALIDYFILSKNNAPILSTGALAMFGIYILTLRLKNF